MNRRPCPQPLARRRLLAAAAAAPLATWIGLASRHAAAMPATGEATPDAAPAEPTPVEAHDLDWRDGRRGRDVPVRLYLPAASAAPAPLVVFSHGIGGSRAGYSYLGRHFASQGVASLHLQHVGSDRRLWSGNPLTLVSRLAAAAQAGEAIARVADLRFALDTLLGSAWGERIDATRLVAAGHSYGANTTLLAAGARIARGGEALDFHDARLRAAIVLSAPPFYGEGDPAGILGAIGMPTLHVTATEDVIRIPGYHSPAADRIAVFEATGGPRKALAVFSGGSHSIFTDRAGTGGVSLNPQVKAATRELALAFVRSVLDGEDGPLHRWPQRHAALLARFERQGWPAG